jgi:hypothetical protein
MLGIVAPPRINPLLRLLATFFNKLGFCTRSAPTLYSKSLAFNLGLAEPELVVTGVLDARTAGG